MICAACEVSAALYSVRRSLISPRSSSTTLSCAALSIIHKRTWSVPGNGERKKKEKDTYQRVS